MKVLIYGGFFYLITSLATSAEEIITLTVGECPPYVSQNLPHYGMIPLMVSESLASEGIIVRYEFYPWKRAFDMALHGESDGTFAWLVSPEKPSFIVSDELMKGNIVLFHLKDSKFEWKTLKDLEGLHIGGNIGADFGEELKKAEQQGTLMIERAPSTEINFRKLLKGRIQIVLENQMVGYNILNTEFCKEDRDRITHHKHPLENCALYLLFSEKIESNKEIKEKLNRSLKKKLRIENWKLD